MYGHRRLCRLVYFKFTYRLVRLAPARLQCTMANACNWTCVLTFILFVFDSSLITRSPRLQTLLTRATRLSSLFQSSHMHSVYESQAQSCGSSPMRAGDFICPFAIVLLSPSLSLFPRPLETCVDFTGPHNHPEGSLKCSRSQGRYCLQCGPDPWCNAEALKKHHLSHCQEAF